VPHQATPGAHATIALAASPRRLVAKAEKGEGVEGGQQQQQPLLRGLFGTLYTLAKEKINDNRNFALATIAIDFVMVVLLFIVPEYPWALEEDSLWVADEARAGPRPGLLARVPASMQGPCCVPELQAC
jgi:hypothetical protein